MNPADDHRCMARALRLARRGLYSTDPNPRVGCVLLRGGEIVGEGWHRRAGGPHAEIHALGAAGAAARGATAYVTLEPCRHRGRTGPCTRALLEAGVARVLAAMEDPNPEVGGGGLRELAAGGVEVQAGLMQAEAEALNPGFLMRMRRGRPFVRAKLAMSLDGRTAMATGESRWITGEAARADVQRLRARSSAILTGIGTVLADNPSLTVRERGLDTGGRQPLRVVLDPALEMPPRARLLGLPGATLVAAAEPDAEARARLAGSGAEVVELPGPDGRVDLEALLGLLARRGINEVLVESGATLSGALLRAGLLDEIVLYVAPLLLGTSARGLFHLPGLERIAQGLRLEVLDLRAVGPDWRVTARVAG